MRVFLTSHSAFRGFQESDFSMLIWCSGINNLEFKPWALLTGLHLIPCVTLASLFLWICNFKLGIVILVLPAARAAVRFRLRVTFKTALLCGHLRSEMHLCWLTYHVSRYGITFLWSLYRLSFPSTPCKLVFNFYTGFILWIFHEWAHRSTAETQAHLLTSLQILLVSILPVST